MNPYQQFVVNKEAAETYIDSYVELRKLKGLGARGKLSGENQYLLWLPRAGIVTAVGALDQYVHQVVYDQLPVLLSDPDHEISDQLADLVLRVATIKNAGQVKEQIELLRSVNTPADIAARLKEQVLQFESFQAPRKIARAYKWLSHPDIFNSVAGYWSGPNTAPKDIADRLELYVKRRNQIAHEGDLTESHEARPITPEYCRKCIEYMWNLVWRLDGIVYDWREGPAE